MGSQEEARDFLLKQMPKRSVCAWRAARLSGQSAEFQTKIKSASQGHGNGSCSAEYFAPTARKIKAVERYGPNLGRAAEGIWPILCPWDPENLEFVVRGVVPPTVAVRFHFLLGQQASPES